MKLGVSVVVLLSVAWLNGHPAARAADRHEGREEAHARPPSARPAPPRPAPPRFQAHPPGVHPHGPMVRPHAVRVLRPSVAKFGAHPWRHWEHAEFARPAYYWDWAVIHNVSCVAEDSYGDQYPVTEETFSGFGVGDMTAIEDDALDRCYAESGGDQSCYLATCSHF
jgi:hypothetical protein